MEKEQVIITESPEKAKGKAGKVAAKGKAGKVAEKEQKRLETWSELIKGKSKIYSKEGQEIRPKSLEDLKSIFSSRLLKEGTTMSAYWPYLVLGYNISIKGEILPKKDSNFKRVTGVSWKEFLLSQKDSVGSVITISS